MNSIGIRSVLGVVAAASVLCASANAAIVYTANLDGPSESPPNPSPGTGFSTVTVDIAAMTMRVEISFSGLLGTTTACHIHGATTVPLTGTAGVASQTPTFSGFPSGVTAGVYDTTFDMSLASSYNPTYITNNGGTAASAFAALTSAMAAGRTYVNVHSSVFGGGEIRGFLVPTPGAVGLLGVGGLVAMRRRR